VKGATEHKQRPTERFKSDPQAESFVFIGMCENNDMIKGPSELSLTPLRDKYSLIKTLKNIPVSLVQYYRTLYQLSHDYEIKGVISTGPGIAIIPCLFFVQRVRRSFSWKHGLGSLPVH